MATLCSSGLLFLFITRIIATFGFESDTAQWTAGMNLSLVLAFCTSLVINLLLMIFAIHEWQGRLQTPDQVPRFLA